MKRGINWLLYSNNELIINDKNILCDYQNDKLIIYKEKDFINKVNLEDNTYIREGKDYILKLDFNKNIFDVTLNDNIFSSKFEGDIEKNNNTIIIEYKIDEDIKKIIIDLL